MATRQALTLAELSPSWLGGAWVPERPGLAVSFLALGLVVVYARILREDVRQYLFWNNVPREPGFVFADLEPDQSIRRITANAEGLFGCPGKALTGKQFPELTTADPPMTELPAPEELPEEDGGQCREAVVNRADSSRVPVWVYIRFHHNPFRGRHHYSLFLADRSTEVQSRDLQETIADLAREAEDLITHEAWGLAHIAERAAKALDVARVNIWWLSPDHRYLRCVENYDRSRGHHSPGEVLETRAYPRYLEALEKERYLAIDSPETDRSPKPTQTFLPGFWRTAVTRFV